MLREVRALGYAVPPDPYEDVPPFVRAASGIRRWQQSHVVIQDDVNALALVDPRAPSAARRLLLPRGHAGRRRFEDALDNKAHKLDLEALSALPDGRLLVLGSGSTREREKLVLVDPREQVRVIDAPELYAELGAPEFAGAQLNIEGAVVFEDTLLVLQRGNGAAREGLLPLNAIGELSLGALLAHLDEGAPAPRLSARSVVELGRLETAALGFTDAAFTADGRLVFLACAEASPDVVRDGEVLGNCFGWFDEQGPSLVPVLDEAGAPCRLKLEGLEARPDDAAKFDVVVDADDANLAAGIGVLELQLAR